MEVLEFNIWCYDRATREIVFFVIKDNMMREVGCIKNFSEMEYNNLPQDDIKCRDYLIRKYIEING